jgi:hypothetical protein
MPNETRNQPPKLLDAVHKVLRLPYSSMYTEMSSGWRALPQRRMVAGREQTRAAVRSTRTVYDVGHRVIGSPYV